MGLSDFTVIIELCCANCATILSTWGQSVWNCAVLTPKLVL